MLPRNTDVTMRIAEYSHYYVHHHCADDECRELHTPGDNADTNEDGQHEIYADNGIEIYHLSVVSSVGSVISIGYNYESMSIY